MDIRWFICMEWVFLHQYINAMVNVSTTLRPSSSVAISGTGSVQVVYSSVIVTTSGITTRQSVSSSSLTRTLQEAVNVSTTLRPSSSVAISGTGSVQVVYSSVIVTTSGITTRQSVSSSSLTRTLQEAVNVSTTLRPSSSVAISGTGSVQVVYSSVIVTTSGITTRQSVSSSSLTRTLQEAESSTPHATKQPPIHKSPSPIIPSYINGVMSSSLRHSSTYGPSVNNGTNLETDGVPLIIVAASAAGAGIVLILIIILCCCCHRRLKRKKNERIFQKYYRPTIPCNSSHDLEVEDDNSNMWASQTKLSIENKDEQSIHPKPHQGISNKAFTTSESLPEMNIIQEKLPPDLPIDIPNDTEQSTSNKVEALNIQEINKSGEDDAGPVQKIPEKDREIDNKLPAEENSLLCDDDRASLLVLQNLDKVLNNECVNDVNTPEGETSDAITSFPDDQEKKDDVEYFVVTYPFQTSNTDEISLDVGTTVSVIENKPSGWSWVSNQDGDTGWFPTQYLALVDTDNGPEESGDVHTNHQIGYSIPDQRRLQFAVLESFSATSPDELSLAKYDIVSVIENSSSGWSWVNEPSVGSGWFPTNYLEPLFFPKKNTRRSSNESSASNYLDIIVDEDGEYVYASSEEIQKVKKEGHYQEYEAKAYRAFHAYTGGNEDELTFKENETILVLQETKTGWWRGSTYLGEGWFPATFVEDPINEDTTDESYEYVDCKEKSAGTSPYEVTELVAKKNRPNKGSNRETVHQVPQAISSQAAKKHKSKGKASVLKPCRPAPPPPSPQRPSVSQPSTVQHVSSLTPALSAAPLPSTRQTDPPSQAFAPLLLPEAHPATQAPQTAPPLSTAPLALPFPALETCPLFQTPPAQSTQENEDSKEPGNVEGVVIVPPRNQTGDTLSKLIKVTKRRSVINPNPRELPPNRPVPIPPPRKARNPPKSTNNHPRPRPIKLPRNLGNKKPDKPKLRNVPEDVPERPPPPVPEKLKEFREKRLSSSEGSLSGQHLNQEHLPRKQPASDNERSQPKPKQRDRKLSNSQEDQLVRNKKNEMASADKNKVSPKPQPRRRSQEQQEAEFRNDNSPIKGQSRTDDPKKYRNKEQQSTKFCEEGKNQEHTTASPKPNRRVSAPEAPLRSHSLSEEPSDDQPKTRPTIKPRSKSLANLFSSTGNGNSDKGAISESQQRSRLHSSDNPSLGEPNYTGITDSHHQVHCDNNQNITGFKSIEPLHPPGRSPPKPKPKTRAQKNRV